MREVRDDINRWRATDAPVALATVISTWGSAPRKPGAKMALTPDGRIAGSVSGGCVEGAVFESGVAALETGRPALLHFGVADETAWDVGLACGGNIDVYVEPLDFDAYDAVQGRLDGEQAVATVTVIDGPAPLPGSKLVVDGDGGVAGEVTAELRQALVDAGRAAIAAGRPARTELATAAGPLSLFADVILPPATLIMVGGVHIAIALADIARTLGYATIVVDPRRAFGSQARFAHADQLIQKWPDKAFADLTINESTAVAMLTHDPKIDDPALKITLASKAFYVGALGSQRTHAKRRARLAEGGVSDTLLDRIHAPIGLDINAQSPEEIALAIMAQIVAVRRGA